MNLRDFVVALTNGTTVQKYHITASGEQQAIILAQAEAIKLARGFTFVSITEY